MKKKAKKTKPRGSNDPALSAFKALQHVIGTTEGPSKPSKKTARKTR